MPPHSTNNDITALGEFLRETRIEQGFELEDIAEKTRVSPKNLHAIEMSDFTALPAEVFARGFYTLYARCLNLDPEDILEMYGQERRNLPENKKHTTPPPNRLAENMKSLADPPNSLPFAYFGLMLLLLLLFGAFLCWYFSWNPASYLSFKLRSLDVTQQSEVALHKDKKPRISQPAFLMTTGEAIATEQSRLLNLSSPSMATAATTQSAEQSGPLTVPGTTKYHVNAIFQEETKVSLIIDDNPQRTMIFKDGEQVSWRATEKLVITLPAHNNTKISLNQIPLQLPKPENDCITLTIPEFLLR